ncbi:MAG: hypothetical protein IJ374_00425 [Lachnospiraceae bacterium]|nr:hypothetical protein [Lachnospiraceae bacterium]
MREKQKLINYVAGMTTLIVALLIVIVVFDTKNVGVSRAVAAKTVALTMASKDEVLAGAPEESYFAAELQNEWYAKYMDYLYEIGYLDPETCPATEEAALSSVTYGELSGWIRAVSGENNETLSVYLVEADSKKSGEGCGQGRVLGVLRCVSSCGRPGWQCERPGDRSLRNAG